MSNHRVRPATTYPAIVGRILSNLREGKGKEQKDLAASLGLSQSAWSRIERGETALTIEQLAIVARELGRKSGFILGKADEAVERARHQGIEVEYTRALVEEQKELVLIGVAALAVIVAAVLLSKK